MCCLMYVRMYHCHIDMLHPDIVEHSPLPPPPPPGCCLTGAGGGGFLIVLAKEEGFEEKLQRVIETVPVSLTGGIPSVHTCQ